MTVHLTMDQRQLARRLHAKGLSLREVARQVSCCGQPGADTVDHIKPRDDHGLRNLAAVHDRTRLTATAARADAKAAEQARPCGSARNESPNLTPGSPGWYNDPQGSTSQRWWDGPQWTEHLQG